jgi:hypothetical protein
MVNALQVDTDIHVVRKEYLKPFVFGGAALFTVVSNTTGKRYTFKAKHPTKEHVNKKGITVRVVDTEAPIFVKLLTGSNNQTDFTYIGFINKEKNAFVHGKKSRVGCDAVAVRVITKMVDIIARGEEPQNATIYHEGRCGKCYRTLTDPESILIGLGPKCRKGI